MLNAAAKYVDINTRYLSFIESFSIKKIKYDTMRATLQYNIQEKGVFTLKAADFSVRSHFWLDGDDIVLNIDNFTGLQNKIKANGTIIVDTQCKKIFTKTDIDINNVSSV